jgi:GT2 family glycosyltransferase
LEFHFELLSGVVCSVVDGEVEVSMKEIGIIICNYNKEDYIVNCIRSVLASSFRDFDAYVVDNASTDRSVERIREEFGDQITLIVNSENLGGSGGFNTGLRAALAKDYRYLMLFDNDIIVDQYAIEELYQFLETHKEVGMVGSKCFFMDYPDRIWAFGSKIDFEDYTQSDYYKNCTDSSNIPEVLYCDYIPACSLMARTEAVRKVGLMPEENFIYWDDMEWGYRFNEVGYKVAAWGRSKIWHKAGGRNAGNTFNNYYMWRNRIRFFLKVLPQERREHFYNTILSDMFRLIYSCNLKGETNIVISVVYAFDDAVHKVAGKAEEYKILPRNGAADRLTIAAGEAKSVLIRFSGHFEGLGNIVRKLEAKKTVEDICISIADCPELAEETKNQFPKCRVTPGYEPEKYEFHMKMCDHIFNVGADANPDIYVDPWCNIIHSKEDLAYCSNYNNSREIFMLCMKPLLMMLQY